jgi:hypothetical protein
VSSTTLPYLLALYPTTSHLHIYSKLISNQKTKNDFQTAHPTISKLPTTMPQSPAPEHFQSELQPLPTPRALLTSLLNTLSTSPPQPRLTTDAKSTTKSESKATYSLPNATDAPSNPLKSLPANQKSLLATLHVLFPPPTLLQALDLLDRGLVTRVYISSPSSQQPQEEQELLVDSSISASQQEEEEERAKDPGPEMMHAGRENTFYRVRSAQSHSRSRYHAHSAAGHAEFPGGGLVYTVRLRAWNCDCAAFAFAAFPPVYPPSIHSGDYENYYGLDLEGEDVGGLSFNGREGGEEGVPVCKHLLACLLAERWEGVLGSYVKERRVGREEGAGIAGG